MQDLHDDPKTQWRRLLGGKDPDKVFRDTLVEAFALINSYTHLDKQVKQAMLAEISLVWHVAHYAQETGEWKAFDTLFKGLLTAAELE